MMKNNFFLYPIGRLFTITFLFIFSSSFAQTVYYANNVTGNDSNSGLSAAAPKKTFTSVFATAPAGSIIDLTGTFTWSDVGETTAVTSGFTINKNMTIRGQGADQTIVQANALPNVANRRVFTINSGVTVIFEKLTIQNGKVANLDNTVYPADGGGLYNSGTLTLNYCRISQNYAIAGGSFSGGAGGGIMHMANNTMTINGCTFDNNQANTGGALTNEFNNASGRFIITNSTFAYNKQLALVATVGGGAIWILNGTNIITNSTFAYNDLNNSNGSGTGNGASILVRQGNVRLKNSIFVNGTRSGQPLSASGRTEIAFSGGSATDEGNNIFGVQSGITFSSTSWQPSAGGGYQNVGDPSRKCQLSVDNSLQTNGATNGIVTLKITGFNINAGSSVANNGVDIPTIDQRGVTRIGTPDIGAYEYIDQAPIVSCFSPSTGPAGTSISISGVNFSGATSVTFNGVEATSFTVNSSESVTAVAPESSTGLIGITTAQGTGNSFSNYVYPPSIQITGTLSPFFKCSGSASSSQTFTISGANLTANLLVATYTNLEYSLDGTTYSSSLSLTPTSGSVAPTTIYVRMTSASTSLTTGNISLTSTNATTRTVGVSGTVSASPTITGNNTVTVGQTITLTGTGTQNASTPWSSSNSSIATVSNSGVVTGVTAGTATITYMNSTGCIVTSSITVTAVTSPTLTISSTNGQTGTSGAGWAISGTNLLVSGNAIVAPSVVTTALNSGALEIRHFDVNGILNITVNEAITSVSTNNLTLGGANNTGAILLSQPIENAGSLNINGNTVAINASLTTTSSSLGNITITARGTTAPISGTGNINIAPGRSLTFSTPFSTNATSSVFNGIISGVGSNLIVVAGINGGIVLTNNNTFTGTTTINVTLPGSGSPTGTLILRNDAPNPASKTFLGNAESRLIIEPSSANFTNTFSNAGYSFSMHYLTIGKANNNSNVSIDSPITIQRGLNVHCNILNLNANISVTSGSGASVEIYCINPLINVIGTNRTITATSVVGIYAQQGVPFSSDLTYPIPNLTITAGIRIGLGGTTNTTKDVIINNDITNTGGFTINGANIVFNGNLISPSSSRSVVLNGNTTVAAGKYIQCAGNFTQNGNITFKSDATGTASFGTLGGTYTTTSGTVTVERYIPARRAFRFLSPSVTTTTSIRANWQNGGVNTSGLGTHITGVNGTTNGFDATSTNNPSLFTFDNGVWSAVTNTNTNVLTAGTPYRLMVRGDRTTDLTSNTPTATATTLRATGTLRTGNFTPTLNPSADGFSLVGNPYQAPIDIKAILNASTNMSTNVVYYWDPTLNVRGGYVTRDLTTDVNDVTSSFNQYVQPGQAVFVKKDNTANVPTMTITEANKSVVNASAGVFRQSNATDSGFIRANLQANINNQWQTTDATLAVFNDSFSWDVTSADATKMSNLDEEVSFVQNNTNLAIATQSNPIATSELPIKIDKLRHTNYQWQFELDNYRGATPYLYDMTNNSYTQINNGTVVSFTADLSTTNRFKIVFQNSALSTDDFTNNIKLYPNPAKAGVSFYLQGISEARVTVYNLLGQNIPIQTISQGNTLQVTPSVSLSKGVYLVNITIDNTTKQVKWVVE